MRLSTRLRTAVASFAFVALALGASPSFADEPKIPQTPAEHESTAKHYSDQATEYKKVAEEHRSMAAAYTKAHPDAKGGAKNSWNVKMQKHCKALAADADKLAAGAQKAADFHSMRAKETPAK